MKTLLIALYTLLLTTMVLTLAWDAAASERVEVKAPPITVLKVIYKAAKRFDVDSQDLIKIAFLESSFRANAKRVNRNGTIDVGMFQVNSVHWNTTCRAFDVFTLKGNAECAAKLLMLAKRGSETDPHWIGRYHSKTPSRKIKYSSKVASLEVIAE